MVASASLPRFAAAPQTLDLKVEGMTCASCVARVEKALRKVPGVTDASVNLATEVATVRSELPVEDAAIAAVRRAGYAASVRQTSSAPSSEAGAWLDEGTRLAIAALLTLPLVIPMVAELFGRHWM